MKETRGSQRKARARQAYLSYGASSKAQGHKGQQGRTPGGQNWNSLSKTNKQNPQIAAF